MPESGATKRPWSTDEDALLRERYASTSMKELRRILDRSYGSISARSWRLELKKDSDVIADEARQRIMRPDHGGRKNIFQVGHPALHRQGKRGRGYAPGRMSETQFKKGERGANGVPVGSTRKQGKYTYVKVSDNQGANSRNWRPAHVVLWEATYGSIPSGHAVCFKDGNKERVEIDNLEMLTHAQLLERNSVHNYPESLREVIRLKGSITRILRRKKKHAKEQNVRPSQPSV